MLQPGLRLRWQQPLSCTPACLHCQTEPKWETINASELGLKMDAFNNRLHVDFAYFNRTTQNLMTYISRASLGLRMN